MINSRKIEDLLPVVQDKVSHFKKLCELFGIDLLITSTYRDNASQTALYAQGRTTPGIKVTNAKAGQSWHNYRCAVDVVPLTNGKPNWNIKDPIWLKVGEFGKQAGLEWAWEWKKFKEMAHFQYTGGLKLAQLKNGASIK